MGHHQRSPDVRLGAGEARTMSALLDEITSPAAAWEARIPDVPPDSLLPR